MVKICARCHEVSPGGFRCDSCGGPLIHTSDAKAHDLPEAVWKHQRVDYGARRGMIVRFFAIFAGFFVAVLGVRNSVGFDRPWSFVGAGASLVAGVALWWVIYVAAGRAVRIWVLRRGQLQKRKLARPPRAPVTLAPSRGTSMRILEPSPRPLAEALALAAALLECASSGEAQIAASLLEGPAVVLGALQRAGRVVDVAACATAGTPVLRRATTGTAAYVGRRAILWTLALPHVAALHPDATPRTLLNRNVRGFLQGLSRGGAPARYFGREWIAIEHRPAALLGFDALRDGRILIEVFAGLDAPIALPAALCADEERAVDRWRSKEPMALAPRDPEAIALQVIEAVAARAGAALDRAEPLTDLSLAPTITDPLDPVPRGLALAGLHRAPIGWIDAAADVASGRLWLGGDALVASFAVRDLALAVARGGGFTPGDAPIDGASWSDLEVAARAALAAGG